MSLHSRIFAAGVVWDPREPFPAELQSAPHQTAQNSLFSHWYNLGSSPQPPHLPTNVKQFSAHLPSDHNDVSSRAPAARTATALPTFTVQEPNRNVLPPLSIILDASVVHDTAKVNVTQVFWNDSDTPIRQAAYTFPLPAGCTVTEFTCRIGTNTVIKGSVKPKEEAREAFKRHIREQQTGAALLEQDTPEIFTTTLGNIAEKTKLKINLSYITILKHHFGDGKGTTTLTFPTCIAARYGQPPAGYKGAVSTDVAQGLTLKIELVESEKIQSIISNTHSIVVQRRPGEAKVDSFADLANDKNGNHVEAAFVELDSGSMFLDKDFILDITTEISGDKEAPQAWLEEHPTIPNHKALMCTLPPGSFSKKRNPSQQRREILFLADRSGSMTDKIYSLRSAMDFFLKGIPVGCTFNVWSFGTTFQAWSPYSLEYNELNLNAALTYVGNHFWADMGGTELLPAIQAIINARDRAVETDVMILTDGETWKMDDVLTFIRQTCARDEGRLRFFSLGIGDYVSHALVEGIAKAGGGYAEVVPSSVRGGWEDRVVSMLNAALTTGHVKPLCLEFNSRDQNGVNTVIDLSDAQRSPVEISISSPFYRNRAYFLFESETCPDTITVKSLSESEYNTVATISVITLEKKDTTLHKLAARSLLDDLEQGRSQIHVGSNKPLPGSWAETSQIRLRAEEIACKWSLVSKWTSFFLVEEPSVAEEGDAIMEGVTNVKQSSEDLLQTRGNLLGLTLMPPVHLGELMDPRPTSRPLLTGPAHHPPVFSSYSVFAAPRLRLVPDPYYAGIAPGTWSMDPKSTSDTSSEDSACVALYGGASMAPHTLRSPPSVQPRRKIRNRAVKRKRVFKSPDRIYNYNTTNFPTLHEYPGRPRPYEFPAVVEPDLNHVSQGTETAELSVPGPESLPTPAQAPPPPETFVLEDQTTIPQWSFPPSAVSNEKQISSYFSPVDSGAEDPGTYWLPTLGFGGTSTSFRTERPIETGQRKRPRNGDSHIYTNITVRGLQFHEETLFPSFPGRPLKQPKVESNGQDEAESGRSRIRLLLKYQKFDGSFDFGSEEVAEACLGKAVLGKLKSEAIPRLISEVPEATPEIGSVWVYAYTLAVVILLRQNLSSLESLWGLMETKAMHFLSLRPRPITDWSMEDLLHGVPIPDQCETCIGDFAETKGAGEDGDTEIYPPRELVERAPSD